MVKGMEKSPRIDREGREKLRPFSPLWQRLLRRSASEFGPYVTGMGPRGQRRWRALVLAILPLLSAQPLRSRPTPVPISKTLMSQTKVRCEKRVWTWPPRNNPAATIGRAPAVDTSVSHPNRPRTT